MKKLLLLTLMFMLTACSANQTTQVESEVETILNKSASESQIASTNHSKPSYRYYLPEDMGMVDSNELGAVFKQDNFTIVMNFTPSAIIISEYYTDLDEEKEKDIEFKHYTEESLKSLIEDSRLQSNINEEMEDIKQETKEISYAVNKTNKDGVLVYSGNLKAANHQNYFYSLKLRRVKEDYYMHFDSTILTLTSIVPAEKVDDMTFRFMNIAKSIQYDKEDILKQYSLKYALEVMEKRVDENNEYIYRHLPSQGYLEELLDQEK